MNKRLWHSLRILLMRDSGKRIDYLRKHNVFGHIGKNTIWRDRLVPLYADRIFLGDNVRCGSRVYFITHDVIHDMLNHREGNDFQFKEFIGDIHVGNNVFIGSNSTILGGANIGSNVIIGAGSLVSKILVSVITVVLNYFACKYSIFKQGGVSHE